MRYRTRKVDIRLMRMLKDAGHPPLIAKLWASRGAHEEASSDFLPSTSMFGCVEAGSMLAQAIRSGSKLVVVADYDADGATACSVMVRGLGALGAVIDYMVPDRLEHGYGLSEPVAELAYLLSPDVLITVDNGIASHAGIARANELGMRVLVTDHHLPPPDLPAAEIIVNPNQARCSFPSKAMAGCGVAWMVVRATAEALAKDGLPVPAGLLESLLPFVAIGTIADVVPLDAHNRLLIKRGLALIRGGSASAGVKALVSIGGRQLAMLSTTDIAFSIGPRLNAAGRLADMSQGIACLLCEDEILACQLAMALDALNVERKDIETAMVKDADTVLEPTDVDSTVVVSSPAWHPGVIGIVASRLKERFYRPTVVFAEDPSGGGKGSGRSIPGFHLRDALADVDVLSPGLLLKFGGHAMAAGLTVAPGRIDEFRQLFELVASARLTPEILSQCVDIDGGLATSDICLENAQLIQQQVWGQNFPEPLFEDIFDVIEARRMGKDKSHLKMTLKRDARLFDAVLFRHEGPLPDGNIRLAYRMSVNFWNDSARLQLVGASMTSVST